MKILNPQSATLTNAELYTHLTSKRAQAQAQAQAQTQGQGQQRQKQRKSKAPAYEAITREILEYLAPGTTSTSAGSGNEDKAFPLPDYARGYSDGKVEGLVRELGVYQLAKAEVLGIVNLRPRDVAGLDALVEEVDERFTAEQQEGILEVVGRWLR